MANLTEVSNFDSGVYQLETTDPVEGGPTGVSNSPLKNLTNRTRWLLNNTVPLAGEKTMTGRLGIQTGAVPRASLDVQGKMILRDTTASASTLIISTNLDTSAEGDSGGIRFCAADGVNSIGPGIRGRANQIDATFARRDIVFLQHDADNYTALYDAMKLTAQGVLSIGGADVSGLQPGSKLLVASDTSSPDPRIAMRGLLATDGCHVDFHGGPQRHASVGGVSGGSLVFYTNSGTGEATVAEAGRFTSQQRFGVGITTPSSKMHVAGGDIEISHGYSVGVIPGSSSFTVGSDRVINYGMTLTTGSFSNRGAYLSGYFGIGLCTNGAVQWVIDQNGNLIPASNGLNDLGSAPARVRNLFISGYANFDTGDYITYDRTNNVYRFVVGDAIKVTLDSNGLISSLVSTGQGAPAAVGQEGLRIINNATANDDAFASIVSGTSGISVIAFGDRDLVNDGTIKYDNSTRQLELWAANDGTGAAGNKLIIGGGGVRSSTSPPADDSSKQVATTEWVQALAAILTPVGMIAPFAMNTPPTGWLECNGADVSRTTYAALFAKIGTTFGAGNGTTTFGLPDLRGEFLRGWDHGRGVDSGRAFGSWQDDDVNANDLRMTFEAFNESSGGTTNDQGFVVGSSDTSIGTINNDSAIVNVTTPAGTHENRPRNVALLYGIKH